MRTHGTTTSTSDDGFRRLEVITGVGRRRRWTDEEKAWIVAESLEPASSVSAVVPAHHAGQTTLAHIAQPKACLALQLRLHAHEPAAPVASLSDGLVRPAPEGPGQDEGRPR